MFSPSRTGRGHSQSRCRRTVRSRFASMTRFSGSVQWWTNPGPARSPRGRHSTRRSASSRSPPLKLSPSRTARNDVSSVNETPRRPLRPLVLGAVLVFVLVAQAVALVAHQMQIDDLQTRHIDLQAHRVEPSPSGPSGPPVRAAPPARQARTAGPGETGKTAISVDMAIRAGRGGTARTGNTLPPSHRRLRPTRGSSTLPWPDGDTLRSRF